MKYTRNGEDYRKTRWTTADLSGEYIGLAKNFTQGFRHDVMEKPKETFWPSPMLRSKLYITGSDSTALEKTPQTSALR